MAGVAWMWCSMNDWSMPVDVALYYVAMTIAIIVCWPKLLMPSSASGVKMLSYGIPRAWKKFSSSFRLSPFASTSVWSYFRSMMIILAPKGMVLTR